MKLRRTLALLISALALTGVAACGDDDDDNGGGSLADAKARLVKDCHRGHEGDDADLKQCQCIVNRLVSDENLDTPAKLDDVRKEVNGGDIPRPVRSAAGKCPKKS